MAILHHDIGWNNVLKVNGVKKENYYSLDQYKDAQKNHVFIHFFRHVVTDPYRYKNNDYIHLYDKYLELSPIKENLLKPRDDLTSREKFSYFVTYCIDSTRRYLPESISIACVNYVLKRQYANKSVV